MNSYMAVRSGSVSGATVWFDPNHNPNGNETYQIAKAHTTAPAGYGGPTVIVSLQEAHAIINGEHVRAGE